MVFVTKYRRKVLTDDIRDYLQKALTSILTDWRCQMIDFGGEDDHVHLLIEIQEFRTPYSSLVNVADNLFY